MSKIIVIALLISSISQVSFATATASYGSSPYFSGQRPVATNTYANPAINPQTAATVAVGDLVSQNLVTRGFAANDPRISTTLQNAGTTLIAGAAPNVAGGIGGLAVTGLCLGGTLGIGSFGCAALGIVAGAVLSTAVSALIGWVISPTNQVTPTNSYSASSQLTAGQPYWETCSTSCFMTGDPMSAVQAAYPLDLIGTVLSSSANQVTYHLLTSAGVFITYAGATYYASASPVGCPVGNSYNASTKVCVVLPAPIGISVPTAIANLTAGQLAQPLDANTLAAAANETLAAAQGQVGSLPASASNPITAAQAQAEINALGVNAPTVADLFTPVQTAAQANASSAFTPASDLAAANSTSPLTGATAPVSSSYPAPGVSAAPTTASNPAVNLGQDPGTPSPDLETPPDGPTIMAPLTTGLASYIGFSVALPAGVCPAPSFDFRPSLNVVVAGTQMCTLYDSVSSKIATIMTLAWMFLFLIIILRA